MKTKREILEETIAYYDDLKKFGRGTTGCEYLTKSGAMCAVGRCLIDPATAPAGSVESWARNTNLYDINFSAALKPEYRGHRAEFWSELQTIHDDCADRLPLTEFAEAMLKGDDLCADKCSDAHGSWLAIMEMIKADEASA